MALHDVPESIKTVTVADLPKILAESPIGTCVQVTDNFCQFLVIFEDINKEKYWAAWDGKNLASAKLVNRWYILGQQMYAERESLPQEMLTKFYQVLQAVALVCSYLGYGEQKAAMMIDEAIINFTFEVYKRDFPEFKGTIDQLNLKFEDSKTNEDFMVRLNMVTVYAANFSRMVREVGQNVAAAANDIPTDHSPVAKK